MSSSNEFEYIVRDGKKQASHADIKQWDSMSPGFIMKFMKGLKVS